MAIIRNRRWTTIIITTLFLLILFSLAGYFIYENQKKTETRERAQDIESINRLKIRQISEWYKDEINDANVISQNPLLFSAIDKVISEPDTSNFIKLTEYLIDLKSEHGYKDIIITTAKSKVICSTTPDTNFLKEISGSDLNMAVSDNNISSSGIYYTTDSVPHFDLTCPLYTTSSIEPIFIRFRIDPGTFLFPLLSFVAIYEETSQTLLLSPVDDSVAVLYKRIEEDNSFLSTDKIYAIKDLISKQDNKNETVFLSTDYRGKEILAFMEQIPGTPWILLSKTDHAELFRSFYRQTLLIILLSTLVFLVALIAISLLYSERQRNIYRTLLQSQKEFRTTLYSIGDAVIITDMAGIITLMNKEAEELTGWKELTAINRKLDEVLKIIHETTGQEAESPIIQVFKKTAVDVTANKNLLISRDGRKIPISESIAPIKDEASNNIGIVLILRDQTEYRERESALIESEEKYYRMFEDSPQPMWIYDINTLEFLEVNEAAILHYGYSRNEFLSMTIKDIRPIEDVTKLLDDVSSTIRPYNNAGIWRHLKKNGELIYVNIKSHEVMYNKRIARHVLANDITDIKIAQDALQESELKFRKLFEDHSAVKLIIDAQTGQIADANEAAAVFYGYHRDELISMNISQINLLDEAQLKVEIQKVIDKQKIHFEFKHLKKDGSICDVEVFSSLINISGKVFLHSIVHDVTEKKKAKQQVKLLIQSIEQSPVGIVITDPKGIVEFVNSRMTELTGYEKNEINSNVSKILHSNGKYQSLQSMIWNVISAGDIWNGEFEDQKKDGSNLWAKIVISPILDDEGVIRHYVIVYEDISEQKKILSELVSAKIKAEESDHLKTAFLANMSHEIRTPMNGILGFMDLLQQPGLTSDQLDEYIKIVRTSSHRLLSTINDIIDISKIESGQSTVNESTVDVNLILLGLFNFFLPETEAKSLDFSISSLLDEEHKYIKVDNAKLQSILINLIKNAIKFTKKGAVSFGVLVQDNSLAFKISDTGIGIPESQTDRIYERFVQADTSIARDYEGSGLGLSIAKAYIEMMGGKISLESKVGSGTTFSFTIPNKKVVIPKKVTTDPHVAQELLPNDLKILIAEDDEISFIYLSRMLSKYNIKLLRAYNGEEAVQICMEQPDISLVFMDIKMPIMDGLEATKKILEIRNDLPIIALTAFALSNDREDAIASGCIDYLSKPAKKETLLNAIRKYSIRKTTV